MKKHWKKILIGVAIAVTAVTVGFRVAGAQVQNQYWKVLSNVLQPVLNAYGIKVPSLGGSGTKCLHVDNNGLFSTATADCGTGSGGGGNVATSTAETAGQLPYWTSTSATPATLGKVATTSVSCSGSTSCTAFTAIGASPVTISSTAGGGTTVFASTTADAASGYFTGANNIGIGSSSPLYKLTVENTGTQGSFFVGDTANDTTGFGVANDGVASFMGGKVGVGLTNPAAPFVVQGPTSATIQTVARFFNVGGGTETGAGIAIGYSDADTVARITGYYSTEALKGQTSGSVLGFELGGVEKAFFNGRGDFYLNATAGTQTNPRTLGFYPAGVERIDFDGGYSGFQAGSNLYNQLYAYWGITLEGNRQGLAPAFIAYNADTTYPSVKVKQGQTTSPALVIEGKASRTADYFQVRSSSATTNADILAVSSDGNVGIGTTTPYAKLSVVGEAVAAYFTATSTTATSTVQRFQAQEIHAGSGAVGFTGTCILLGLTSITVEDGLITSCQ